MTLRRILAIVLPLLMFVVFESEVNAQLRPIHRAGRFLGLGWGNGFHTRTPGPVVDHYNPYSVTNSYFLHRQHRSGLPRQANPGYFYPGAQYNRFQWQPTPGFNGRPSNQIAPSARSNVRSPAPAHPRRQSLNTFEDEPFEIPRAFRPDGRN